MAKKKTTGKAKGTSRLKRAATRRRAKRSESEAPDESEVPRDQTGEPREESEEREKRVPIEHYCGERYSGRPSGEPGSLEDETLDRNAPYNKTYGRQ